MNAPVKPDIVVKHHGYIVEQIYALSVPRSAVNEDENLLYGQWWYKESGEFIMHVVTEYMSEDELKEKCEQMDYFLLTNRSRIE